MAWRQALTRDALVALKGDDGIGNGTDRELGYWKAEEEERCAEDDEDEEAKSKQNTFRKLQALDGEGEDGSRPETTALSNGYIASHGRRSTSGSFQPQGPPSTGYSRTMSSKPADGEASVPARVSTGVERASRMGTASHSQGSSSRPGTRAGSSRQHTKASHRQSTTHDHSDMQYGVGQDIVLHLKPSLPGVGHTEYSNWVPSEGQKPHLPRCTVHDYLSGPDQAPTPYIQV
jgi:hypothetical protein